MDKTSCRVLALTVGCMLLLLTTAQQAIAWPCSPSSCGGCEGICTETGCENNCIPGYCCDNDNCEECPECDDCKSCNAVNCECESDCAAGQCCDDDDCVDNCPGGGCCDDGTCVDNCPGGECCDDGTCVSSCPSGECCDGGDCEECPVCDDCESCNAANCECECTSECCTDSDCGDTDCWNCVSCNCECDITINSVSSDDFACVDCEVEFTADVTGDCSCVDWSGGGDPATASGTCTFTTKWDTHGVKTVTATPDCGTSKQKQVTIVKVQSLLPDVGTEIDDGDDNPDTKSFVVCVAATGVVTVTATPNPSVSEENLPGCWSLTGGAGSSKLTRTIDRTTASTTVITCTCNTSSKITTIHVIDGLTVIPREAYVCVNCTKDFQAWACDGGGTAQNVTSESTFSTSNGSFNGNTLTAGSTPSPGEGDDWVKATHGSETTDDAHDCDLTVVQVVFSPDPLCVPVDGTASLTATVTPSSVSSQVTFDTADISIATVSGSAPNLTVHGVSVGNTQVRAKVGECVCETVDVTVRGCTQGRKYVYARIDPIWTLYGIKADIKTRWGNLCGGSCGEIFAFSAAWVSCRHFEPKWGQMGYRKQRNSGSTTTKKGIYYELVGNTVHRDWHPSIVPGEDSVQEYKIQLDKTTGTWSFYYDGSFWISVTDTWWVDTHPRTATWSGEILNKEDDMPGTEGNPCNFTNCGYWKGSQGYQPASFVDPDSYFTSNETQWDYEHVSSTAFDIWDVIPGQ